MNGVGDFDERAECARRAECFGPRSCSLMHSFLVSAQLTLDAHSFTSCFHSIRVLEKGTSHDPQHLCC